MKLLHYESRYKFYPLIRSSQFSTHLQRIKSKLTLPSRYIRCEIVQGEDYFALFQKTVASRSERLEVLRRSGNYN